MNIRLISARVRTRLRRTAKRVWFEATSPRLVSAQKLSEEVFLAKFDLDGHAVTKETLLAHYAHRVTPAWPSPPGMLHDIPVNTDELSPKEFIALADSILECRFVLDWGVPQVTPEGNIAWHLNPTPNPEWPWVLNRHSWWPVLGLAYAQTGDDRYATAFVTQMLDWVKESPPPGRRNERSPSWRLMEVGLRMRISWIPCFALFFDSPPFTDEAKLSMLRAIYDHAQFLYLFKTRNNHLLRESNGLAYIGTYFPEFKEASLWRQAALTRLDGALAEQVNQDGSHFEVSTGYQSLAVDEFRNTFDLLRINNLSFPKQDLGSWLEKMYGVMAYVVRPDGTFPQVNDGYIYWDYTQLAQAGQAFGRNDLVYIGTGGSRGTCPTDTSVNFNDAGLYVMRSDWTEDARYLLFDAGPYGGHHGHEDKLSIELFAVGQAFIVDSGSYNYNQVDPFRAYFVGSQGHNTILVDGKSQIRRWYKDNRHPKVTRGNYATWISQPGFDYVSASYGDGYSSFSLRKPLDAVITKDVTHTRRILFVKPDYWVIVDELEAAAPHNYQALFHTDPKIVATVGPENRVILGTMPETATLHLIPAAPQNVKVSCVTGSESPIQGWYSAGVHQKTPATVIIYERENCASTTMTTLLYPCPSGQRGDSVCIKPLGVSGGKGLAFVVTTERGRDYLLFSLDDSLSVKRFGSYQSRGIVAGVRTDNSGNTITQFES